jgi:type VI secretion system protein ImpH
MQVAPDLMPQQKLSADEVRLGFTTRLAGAGMSSRNGWRTRVQLGVWTGSSGDRTPMH